MERLDFTISDQIVLSFEIDHEQKTARLLPSTDPLATHVILTSEEKTYQGIERRLNEMQQTTKTLKAQLKDIQAKGFHAPMQQNLGVNHSRSSITATIDAPVITLPSDFGNTNINGLQHKDNLQIDSVPHFVKLDSLSPAVNGTWKSDFNAQYSSVSEALTSILAKNIKNADSLNSVLYEWREFELNGQKVTGTISKNFLQAHEEEHVLAVDRKIDPHTHLSVKDYEENMYDAPTDTRIQNLTKAFSDIKADPKDIHQFLIQQAAFDMLVGNQDRLNNPSNFVFAYNVKDQSSRMVNLDYGRTLPLIWTETTENNYSVEEFLQEDLIDFADNLNTLKKCSKVIFLRTSIKKSHLRKHLYDPLTCCLAVFPSKKAPPAATICHRPVSKKTMQSTSAPSLFCQKKMACTLPHRLAAQNVKVPYRSMPYKNHWRQAS